MPRSRPIRRLFLPPARSNRPELGQVQLWVRSPRRRHRWLGLLVMAVGIWAGLGLLLLSLRWGLLLMFNPQALPELRGLLQPPASPLETVTLNQLEAEAAAANEQLGEPLSFVVADPSARYWLLPVYGAAAQTLTAVRIYQLQTSEPNQLYLIAQSRVVPVSETEAFGPLLGTPQAPPIRQRSLPLTQVVEADQPGWFNLEGRWQRGGVDLRYGRTIHFDPATQTLQTAITWSSPTAQRPQWVDLDGSGYSDLLVDESVGLEPALWGVQVFEQQGLGPSLRLRPVSLASVPVDSRVTEYRQALTLAQAGMWSEAADQMQALKPQLKFWPAAAEAQLRLIDRHAAQTRQQAEQTWSSPNQKILAQLIDGRWAAALTMLKAEPEALEPLQRILAQDEGRIWNRVSASLRLRSEDSAALIWGGLILQAEKDTATAIAWLDQRQAELAVKQQFQGVLALAAVPPRPAPSPQPATESDSTVLDRPQLSPDGPITAAIGTVRALDQLQPEAWDWGPSPVELEASQTWYAIDVMGQLRGNDWLPPGAARSAATWQQLAPIVQSMQLLPQSSSEASIPLRLRALQSQGNRLTLLASGRGNVPLSAVALAYSPGSLAWLNPKTGLPANQAGLRQGLQSALADKPVTATVLDQVMAQATYYPLRMGDQAERVIMLDRTAVDLLLAAGVEGDRMAPKAIIMAADGQITYSNLLTAETLVAVTDGGSPQLLLWTGEGYQLRPYQ